MSQYTAPNFASAAIITIDTQHDTLDGQPFEIPGTSAILPTLPNPTDRLDSTLLLAGGVQSITPNEAIIYKPRWGAFYQTPLQEYLRSRNISTLIFMGCNFPNCPRLVPDNLWRAYQRLTMADGGIFFCVLWAWSVVGVLFLLLLSAVVRSNLGVDYVIFCFYHSGGHNGLAAKTEKQCRIANRLIFDLVKALFTLIKVIY